MALIDTHCHLDAAEFDDDRAAVAARAAAAGVEFIVVPAIERANFGAVASVCREFGDCRPAYGIHPMVVGRAQDDDLDALRATLQRERPAAVGEIGLDYFVPQRDEARQEFFFVEQLKIARDLGLPVLLHVRKAVDAVLKHLRRIELPGGIAHAFNGSRQQAETFLQLGFKLGFGGAMTHARATHLRELATTLPLSAIVLETDAPDIPPAWLEHGARNQPAELARIAAVLAELRGLAPAAVAAATSANARVALPALAAS
ncbi:MAG: TatD family hydrolase [Rhodocyclaceae bacterium]|nr:TatD family hydrolase [Rhodocyclaceae bacterium]